MEEQPKQEKVIAESSWVKVYGRDSYGWIGAEYANIVCDTEDADPHEMLALLIANEDLYIFDPPNMFVIANDLFAWGCADAEDITWEELPGLFKRVIANPRWGSTIWCCVHRNEQPQDPIVKQMKEQGAWTDELESLPVNHYWMKLRERRAAEQPVGRPAARPT